MSDKSLLPYNFVIGYHGTDEAVKQDVLDGRDRLEPSRRGFDWLGDGIYFWEDDPRRALWWANRMHEEGLSGNRDHALPLKVEKPAVLGAMIYLGNCLNLTFEDNISGIQGIHDEIVDRYRLNKWSMPTNDDFYRNLDALVVNETCKEIARRKGIRVDTVRGIFVERDGKGPAPAFDGSLLFAKTYKMIAVRSRKMIVDYFDVDLSE